MDKRHLAIEDIRDAVIHILNDEIGMGRVILLGNRLEIVDDMLWVTGAGPIEMLDIGMDETYQNAIRLEDIRIAPADRGRGVGSKIMAAIVDALGRHGLGMTLSANPLISKDDPGYEDDHRRLCNFYRKFGGVPEFSGANVESMRFGVSLVASCVVEEKSELIST